MAPHEGEEDPAVYRSGSSKKHTNSHHQTQNGRHIPNGSSHARDDDSDMDEDEDEDEDDDDGTLLTVQPGFNRLMQIGRAHV